MTDRGHPWPLRDLLASTPEAELIPVLFGDSGDVLNLGRAVRLASCAQRRVLAARDGGCAFPGCDKPASWTQAHHVREWTAHLGPTDVDNLCLLCRYHHRTFEARGWQVRMRDGTPEWIPPAWIDRERRPRRNTAHHPPDLLLDHAA